MKILIEKEVAIKLKSYTKFAKGEISGVGKSIINEDGDIQIVDIALFDQECTGAHTDIDDKSMAKFMYEMHQRNEPLDNWNVWWHTHADFDVYWSQTDDDCIVGHKNNNEYLVSIVTNKAGDLLGRLDVFPKDNSPFKKEFIPVKYECDVEYLINEEEKKATEDAINLLKLEIEELDKGLLSNPIMENECKNEVEEKVREKEYIQTDINDYPKQWNYQSYGKKSKKKRSYYEKDENGQKDYENTLDDILLGQPINNNPTGRDIGDRLDEMEHCPECQNPIIFCECEDAFEKWGDKMQKEGIDDYLFNKQFGQDDYPNDFDKKSIRENNLLPIFYKNDK